MPINVYLNATAGLANGTLDVQGDGIGLSLTNVGDTATFGVRCPAGEVNADAIVATAPTDCHITADGVTYGATATKAAGSVGDTNSLFTVKRVADSGNTEPLALTVAITGLTNTEAAPMPNVAPVMGAVTVSNVTASGATVTFSATDANGDPLTYKVAVITSATPPSDWSGYPNVTSPYSATGLTAETAHYAHVLASDGTLTDVATSTQFTTLAADTTAPVIAGTLTAIPTATQGQVTLAGPTATDNVAIAKWQYQVDGGAWVDVASTSGTFPSTVVSGLLVGSHDFGVRAVDASSNASAALTDSATVVLGIIYEQDFSGLSLGASALGYDGWERSTNTNNTYSTFNAATYNTERMVELKTSASDPAPNRAYFERPFSVDTTGPTKVSFKVATSLAAVQVNVTGTCALQLNASALQIYNGSSWVNVATGLASGAIHAVSVTAVKGSNTADFVVDGTAYNGVVLAAAAGDLTRLQFGISGTGYTAYAGQTSIEAV